MTRQPPPETSDLRATARRIINALFIGQSLFSAAFIAAFTLSPIIASTLAANEQAAGLPSTVTLISRALMAYPIGWLMDRWGRRSGLSLGFVLGTLGAFVSVAAIVNGSLWGFLAGAALMGMMRAGADQARYVAAEVQPPAEQARAIGLVVFAGTIGSIGGPLLVGPTSRLAAAWGLPENAGPFLAATLLFALGLLITFLLLRPDPLQIGRQIAAAYPLPDLADQSDRQARPLLEIFRGGRAQLAVLSMAISQFIMSLLMVITPVHMSHFDHSREAISGVIMAHTLGMFGLSSVTGWLIERFGQFAIIACGTLLLLLSSLIAPISPQIVPLVVALFLLGLGWNFCYIAGSSLLASQLAPAERGRTQGASETVVGLMGGAASLSSGLIFAGGGIRLVSSIGLGFGLLLLTLTIWRILSPRTTHLPA
ncbi:MAG: MFS transporter [Anaerolineales bacterium]|nr:MFS transporter [Anaerolineales bacterium]MCB8952526.1 MFS transporter [Ardenticatenales bacterium]